MSEIHNIKGGTKIEQKHTEQSVMINGLFGFFIENQDFKFNLTSNDYIQNIYPFSEGLIGREVINKLDKDRFFVTKDKVTICFEGINLSEKLVNIDDFFSSYQSNGIDFVNDLKGVYSGYVLDENTKKLYIFNDNLATKPIYYYFDQKYGFAFASSLQTLTGSLKKNNIPFSMNKDAVYMMALYAFILGNQTYVSEIKSLPYSSLLTYDFTENKLKIEKLFSYKADKIDIDYNDAIDKIEKLLVKSIDNIWKKNKQYSDKYFTLLSGGMDARVNAVIAKELGYKNITSLTFGQSKSKDMLYAEKIAVGESFNHYSRLLNGGNYLIDNIYENYIVPNDGMIFFNGSAHMSSSLRQFDLKNFPIIHSGQIGDVLFGAFNKQHFDFFKNKQSIGYTGFVKHPELLEKISSLDAILQEYQEKGYELYAYEQRQIHATIMGDRSIAGFVDTISPFYDKELIQLCVSLPDSYKNTQRIYFDWLKKYHPQVLNYPWDKIEMKPTSFIKIKLGYLFKRYFNGFKKYFNLGYESMNPYGKWLKENKKIELTLKEILEAEITKPYIDNNLKKDLLLIYADDIFESRNKFAVVTTLLALKLHFG